METARLQANIWKLYALKALRGFMLMMPVMVLFLQDIGLTLTEVFIAQSVFAIASIVLEVPSGYFADRYGARPALIIGSVAAWLGITGYALSFDFVSVLIAEIILGISAAFISGADSALLYETTHALEQGNTYKQREGWLVAVNTGSEGVAALLGGILALISLRTPIVLQAVVVLAMIPIAWSLYEPAKLRTHKFALASGTAFATMWRTFVHTLHTHKKLKWLVFYGALIDASGLVFVWFRQPYFELAGLPLVWFGIVWAGCMFITALAAIYAPQYEKIFGKKWGLVMFAVFTALSFVVLGMSASILLVSVVLLHSVIRGFKEPLVREYVQALANPAVRATILSIKGFVGRGIFAVAGPFFGYVADVYTVQTALLAAGVVFGALCFVSLVQLARHKAFVV